MAKTSPEHVQNEEQLTGLKIRVKRVGIDKKNAYLIDERSNSTKRKCNVFFTSQMTTNKYEQITKNEYSKK